MGRQASASQSAAFGQKLAGEATHLRPKSISGVHIHAAAYRRGRTLVVSATLVSSRSVIMTGSTCIVTSKAGLKAQTTHTFSTGPTCACKRMR